MFGRKSHSAKLKVTRADQLQSDFSAVTSLFTAHPFISIKETFGVPAEKYRIVYTVEGLHQTGKAIEAKNEHIVDILLPPGYPESPPYCKSISPVFHPNFDADIIDIKEQWSKGMPLADLIVRIGEMIAFQKYSTTDPVNAEAGKWADRNSDMLPLSGADLHAHVSVRAPEPAPVKARAEESKTEVKKPGQPVSDGISVNEIVIHEQEAEETPGPDDGRKTEGILVNADTAQLSVEQVSDAAPAPEEKDVPKSKPVQTEQSLQVSSIASAEPAKESIPVPVPEPLPRIHDSPPVNEPGTADTASTQKPAAPPMILFEFFYCPFCGNKNNKDANFCMNCGARIKPLKKRNITRILSVIAMIVIPVVILAAGVTTVLLHTFNHAEKEAISFPASQPQPVQEKPALPEPEPSAAQPEKKESDEAVTAEDIARKMTRPQEPAVQKARNVFAPGRLTEQQKSERIASLLQNARLYLNIGSYDDAIKRYQEVLKLNPTNFEASMGLDSAQEARDKAPPRLPPAQPEE